MARRVMVDTNVFYILLLGPPGEARRVAEALEDKELYTTPTVVAELLHLLTLRYLKRKGLVKGSLSLKKWIRSKGYPEEVLEAVKELLEALRPTLLPEAPESWGEILETAAKYRLPSNDALITLTCRKHGIDTLATLDEDFKRIPWLKIIP
jgi:hypothetical protein